MHVFIHLPFDPAVLFLVIYPRERKYVPRDLYKNIYNMNQMWYNYKLE